MFQSTATELGTYEDKDIKILSKLLDLPIIILSLLIGFMVQERASTNTMRMVLIKNQTTKQISIGTVCS